MNDLFQRLLSYEPNVRVLVLFREDGQFFFSTYNKEPLPYSMSPSPPLPLSLHDSRPGPTGEPDRRHSVVTGALGRPSYGSPDVSVHTRDRARCRRPTRIVGEDPVVSYTRIQS